ncbi:unnamed protein product [Auanema sp. JU1783]|nr:unnamed protein product [Auanema sp. JU1783]
MLQVTMKDRVSNHFTDKRRMEDVYSSSKGLSMLLSAVAQPLVSEDELGLDWSKQESTDILVDSAGNSPSSLLSMDEDSSSLSNISTFGEGCDINATSFSTYENFLAFTDPACHTYMKEEKTVHSQRRPIMMRKRLRECSMVCWLFRTLLTSEYRALPLNAIFEIFEDTNPSSAHGRHWRQSIRHCLMSSAVFVRVLTPNPRKDFLVMNEAGSWWTVHPDCETACAEEVFQPGLLHRCPPNTGGVVGRMRSYRVDDTSEIIMRDAVRQKWKSEKIFGTKRKPLLDRSKKQKAPLRPSSISLFSPGQLNPSRGDHLVVDHEEEVVG